MKGSIAQVRIIRIKLTTSVEIVGCGRSPDPAQIAVLANQYWSVRPRGALSLALAPLTAAKFLPLVAPHAEFGFLGISYVTFRVLEILFCVQDGLITSLPAPGFFTYFFLSHPLGGSDRSLSTGRVLWPFLGGRFEIDWKRIHSRQDFFCQS